MSRLITGDRPKIETKTYAVEYSKERMIESRGEVEYEAASVAASRGVPPEATLSREENRDLEIVTFTWRWWEVTL